MYYMQLGRLAYYEGRYSPNESDCLEFAKARNPLRARSDFFLGMGYAKADDILVQMQTEQDHGLPGSNWDRAVNSTHGWR